MVVVAIVPITMVAVVTITITVVGTVTIVAVVAIVDFLKCCIARCRLCLNEGWRHRSRLC